MAIPIIMPRQGQSVETCIISRWFKQRGESVRAGDILFSYETDKAAFDMESPSDGTLLDLFFEEGAEVPVLVNVAVLGTPGENYAAYIPGGEKETGPARPLEKAEDHLKDRESQGSGKEEGLPGFSKIRISPRARRLAIEAGVNYNGISGSGPYGRIVVSDIEKFMTEEPRALPGQAAGEFTDKPLSNVRRLIAGAMHSSLQNSAQLTHHMSADVRKILEARKMIKEAMAAGTGGQDITINDMICWCVIQALLNFPEANSHFLGESIRTFNRVHLGIAVDTPRGLMVPSVRNADRMDLKTLSRELKNAAETSKKGNIDPELLQSRSASFTVSNLGSYGVEMFTPVINLPQVAILGVCTVISRPADLGNNVFGFVPFMGLSLTYDHRAIDGGPATLFLKEIKRQIESFTL